YPRTYVFPDSLRDAERVGEVPECGRACERRRARDDDGRGSHHDHHGAERRVRLLVVQPARRDALVDAVRLLEEQLPRRDCGADNGEDHQRAVRREAASMLGTTKPRRLATAPSRTTISWLTIRTGTSNSSVQSSE